MPGKLWMRSLPGIWTAGKNSEPFNETGAPHEAPLFDEVATRTFDNPVARFCVAHATCTLVEPPPANRGTEPVSNVVAPGLRITPADQVGGVAVMMLSENVALISTPPGITAVEVKFDQLMSTRPVSGSTSKNSLSAASRAFPPVKTPVGFVAAVTSKGPVHVCPQSVERCTLIVCAEPLKFGAVPKPLSRMDE